MENKLELILKSNLESEENKFVQVFNYPNYPVEIREGLNEVLSIISENKTLPELYPEELQDTTFSTSIFQDVCVQMEQHFTPHKKLRQALLELNNKLEALDNAKNGHKRAIVKLNAIKSELEILKEVLDRVNENNSITLDDFIKVSSITLHHSKMESVVIESVFSESFSNMLLKLFDKSDDNTISNPEIIKIIKTKIETAISHKMVDFEEASRSLKSAQHLIKDAAIKAYQYRKQIEQYRKEVEASDLSFEEAEAVYYVIYFTRDAEVQLRQGGMLDRGTFSAISQLPDGIRNKVLSNINFIRKKLEEGYPIDGDFIFKVYMDQMLPQKTGPNEIEHVKIDEFTFIPTYKILTASKEDKDNGNQET